MRWRWLVLAVAAIVSLEVASLVAGALFFGPDFISASREERAKLAGDDPAAPADAEAMPLQGTLEGFTLHPYLGFVADPASRSGPVRDAEGRLEATDLGFFRRTGSRVEGDPLRVAIFGGSVAFLFGLTSNQRPSHFPATSSPSSSTRSPICSSSDERPTWS